MSEPVPGGSRRSWTVADNRATTLGNGTEGQPQTLQGNVPVNALDYAISASVTPHSSAVADRDSVLLARCTDRETYYYAGIASWGHKYAIGVVTEGANRQLDGVGDAAGIIPDTTYHLTFALSGSTLELYDGGQLVALVVDPTLIPATSYVGMQSSTPTGSTPTGQTSFGAATVTTLPRH